MKRGVQARGLALLGLVLAWSATGQPARAGETGEGFFGGRPTSVAISAPEIRLPLEQLSPDVREKVRQVLDKPALTVRGPAETFACVPATYHWLVENPDRAVVIWKRIGARCVEIANRGNGSFGWSDPLGSELTWSTVHQTPEMKVIYASGHVKAAMLLPRVAVQAVVVLHYNEDGSVNERAVMKHQAEMAIRTDSKAIGAAARMMGASAQRLGEQYMGQLQMFYGALAWYLDQHPNESESLLKGLTPN